MSRKQIDSFVGSCTTDSCTKFCQVHVVVTAFGEIWQQLVLPSHGLGLPFSWLECFQSAQLLLEHCTLNTATAGDRAMFHRRHRACGSRAEMVPCGSAGTLNVAGLLLDCMQAALHDMKLSCGFAKVFFNHCQE